MRDIFLEKSYTKCSGENIHRPISNQHWAYLWINSLSFYTGHGVKVGPGPRDAGPRDPGPPSKFKSGTRDSPKV